MPRHENYPFLSLISWVGESLQTFCVQKQTFMFNVIILSSVNYNNIMPSLKENFCIVPNFVLKIVNAEKGTTRDQY